MKSTPSPPPAFVRVSERDLTEIELHSVDSINDLHRTHSEQHSKGVQPPRPPPPSTNGNLQMQDRAVVYQTGQPVRRPCVSRLNDICTSTRRHYFLACAAIIAFLLTLILIFSFLVQQSSALHTLLEMVKQKQETAEDISQLLQQLHKLHINLTGQRP
ncbi:hypothetical protein ABG768_026426 [Culter alburnus]|uniref:Uncharacterized protein n=1 Tax=Culter alburnus TaxID=194366 RepID=A0AAW2ABR0_CULAL|nr:uncharacterized protein si:dkey-20d21.12 [Megalobrama amblycephala]XP_048066194.1 uncharacterized protein si:dkey-20d21.12 [Megalobrama amblycephala]